MGDANGTYVIKSLGGLKATILMHRKYSVVYNYYLSFALALKLRNSTVGWCATLLACVN